MKKLEDGDPFKTRRMPFQEGEPVIIIEPQGQKHFLTLRRKDKFHHIRMGHISHDEIIGSPPGALLTSEQDQPVVCLRLTFEDYILKRLKRRTSIIHPKDLASLVMRGDLFPGASVLEAGIGSGAVTTMLLRLLGQGGRLVSCERRPEFIKPALENVEESRSLFGDSGAVHQVVQGDVYYGIGAADLDMILLDIPEPDVAAPFAWKALRPGGVLLSWLPTVNQVYILGRHLQQFKGWGVVEIRELIQRSWDVAENALRPFHKMTAHTGFLIRARKLDTSKYRTKSE
ncbi:MAG: tRNA (adenine-N1)-methyltransferase [Acidobacteriota bacterium]